MSDNSLDLLIKMLKMTTVKEDTVAIVALRKAEAQMAKLGWDWDSLLRGKVKVIEDPFAAMDRAASGQPMRPNYTPPPPRAPAQPQQATWQAPPKPAYQQPPRPGAAWIWNSYSRRWEKPLPTNSSYTVWNHNSGWSIPPATKVTKGGTRANRILNNI